jgi:hypothetical protein
MGDSIAGSICGLGANVGDGVEVIVGVSGRLLITGSSVGWRVGVCVGTATISSGVTTAVGIKVGDGYGVEVGGGAMGVLCARAGRTDCRPPDSSATNSAGPSPSRAAINITIPPTIVRLTQKTITSGNTAATKLVFFRRILYSSLT